MRLTDIRIQLCDKGVLQTGAEHARNEQRRPGSLGPPATRPAPGGRLKAYCALTFDNTFVIRDVKLIDGNDGLFLAMPSRKLSDHCPRCREKNHLRARFCNQCGARLDENRYQRYQAGNGNGNGSASQSGRLKLHADIAHPINAECRNSIEQEVVHAYYREIERSRQPGYVAPTLDGGEGDLYDDVSTGSEQPGLHLRPTGMMQ